MTVQPLIICLFFFITILQRFLMSSLVAVESFPLLSLDAFPPTSSADSKTILVWLSFKSLCLHLSRLLVMNTCFSFYSLTHLTSL